MESKLRAEQWLFLLFVASLPFPTVIDIRIAAFSLQLSDLCFLAATAAWAVRFLLRRDRLNWNSVYFCLAAYFAAAVMSTIGSANPAFSAAKLVGKFYLIGIAVLTLNSIDSMFAFRRVLQAWVFGAAIAILAGLIGIAAFYLGFRDPSVNLVLHPNFGSLMPGNYPRIEGFFLYPAMLSNFLGISWIFLLVLGTAGWVRNSRSAIIAVGMLIVNAFTLTPGLGGIFLTSGFWIRHRLVQRGKRGVGTAVLGVGILVAALFLFVAAFTFMAYGPAGARLPILSGELTPSHRAVAWRTAFATFASHPILGYGVGMPVASVEFIDPSGDRQYLTDAHNTYLSVLGETGIFGFAAFFGMISFVVVGLIRSLSDGLNGMLRLGMLLAICDALLYQGITGSYEDSRHVWVLLGIAAAAPSVFQYQQRRSDRDLPNNRLQ